MLKNKLLALVTALTMLFASLPVALVSVSAQEPTAEWLYSSDAGASITGDNEIGYGVRLNGGTAYYNKPLDPGKTVFQFNPQNIPVNTWVVLSVTDFNKAENPDIDYGGWTCSDGINLMIARHLTDEGRTYLDIDVMNFVEAGYNPKVSLIWDYDFTKPVSIDFRQVDGHWRLFVDGVMQKNTDMTFDHYFEKFGDTAYYNFNNQFTGDDVKFEIKVWDTFSENVTLTQDGDKGIAVFDGDSMAAMDKKINMLEDTVCFKLNPPHDQQSWTILQIAANKVFGDGYGLLWDMPAIDNNGGGLPLFFESQENGNCMKLWIYTGSYETSATDVALINFFNWNATHTVRIVKEGDAYYVELDNIVYKNVNVARWVEKLDGKDAYVRWATGLHGLKVETSVNTEVDGSWLTDSGSVSVTGNKTDGYAFEGNVMAGYSLPFDLEKQELSVTANPTNWLGVRFTDDYTAMGVENRLNYGNGITFIVERQNGNMMKLWHLGSGQQEIRATAEFDWTAPHTYGLSKEDGRWYFRLDGETLKTADLTDIAEEMLSRGNVFLQLTCSAEDGTSISCSGIKIVNKSAESEDKPGDISGDGNIDSEDLILLKKSLFDSDIEYDVNRDGEFNILDLIYLKKAILAQV